MSLAPDRVGAIRALAQVARDCGMELTLIGAMARICGFDRVHGVEPSRTTLDVDFAVRASSWVEHEAFVSKLCLPELGEFERVGSYRLRHRLGCSIDLVPFGAIAPDGRTLVWPDGMEMSIEGFVEASSTALEVDCGEGVIVRCPSAAGVVVTKAIAHRNRGADTTKDLADILHVASFHPDLEGPDDLRIAKIVPRSFVDERRNVQARERAWRSLEVLAQGIEQDLERRR